MSPCINYTHHLHIHYVVCTNESICLIASSPLAAFVRHERFKEKKEKWYQRKGHLGKVHKVNGAQPIFTDNSSIVLLYGGCVKSHSLKKPS